MENRRMVVHCKKSPYDVYIGRASRGVKGSVWGNPFVIGKDGDRATVIRKYREYIMARPDLIQRARDELKGRVLSCWCSPEACHGDVLVEIANSK